MQKTYSLNGKEYTMKPYSIRMLSKYNLQVQLPLGMIVPQKKKEFIKKYNLDTTKLDNYNSKIFELEEIVSSFKGDLPPDDIEIYLNTAEFSEEDKALIIENSAALTPEDLANLKKFKSQLSDVKTAFANDKDAQETEYQFMRINDACTVDLLQDPEVMQPLFPELLNGDIAAIDMASPEYNAFIKEVMLDFFSLINPKPAL